MLCAPCVYYPRNLPPSAYAPEDWAMLRARTCAVDCLPGDDACADFRKTHCAIVRPDRS